MQSLNKYVPSSVLSHEIEISKSRFIAAASSAFSEKEAREFISCIKKQYPDASHNVSAFIIGAKGNIITHFSDDGEPSGTAGRPVLSVLSGSVFTNIVLVVTRYFGGIKLGTGGLVKAYSQAAKELVNLLPKSEITYVNELKISISYTLYDRFLILCSKYSCDILNNDFSSDISCFLRIRCECCNSFLSELTELTSANAVVSVLETNKEVLYQIG